LGSYVGDVFNSPACNSLDWKTNGDKILAACKDSKGYMVGPLSNVVTDTH
jgi:hypothetical protein